MIPLVELVGNENDPPEQIAGIWLNVGVALFTLTVMVVVVAHCPLLGVKV